MVGWGDSSEDQGGILSKAARGGVWPESSHEISNSTKSLEEQLGFKADSCAAKKRGEKRNVLLFLFRTRPRSISLRTESRGSAQPARLLFLSLLHSFSAEARKNPGFGLSLSSLMLTC